MLETAYGSHGSRQLRATPKEQRGATLISGYISMAEAVRAEMIVRGGGGRDEMEDLPCSFRSVSQNFCSSLKYLSSINPLESPIVAIFAAPVVRRPLWLSLARAHMNYRRHFPPNRLPSHSPPHHSARF